MPRQIEFIAETGSTNAALIARLARGERLNEGYWLVADRQTAGRGRQGRSWFDASGNFMGSCIARLEAGDPPAPSLSFVAALAVYEAIVELLATPASLQLKWPNDVLLDGKKIAGILLEREGDAAVIGIGVNLVNAPQVSGREVMALAEHGPAPARDVFAAALAQQLERELRRWRDAGVASTLQRWLAVAHPVGTPLTVHNAGGSELSGRFDGLEEDGGLRLRLADGSTHAIRAGDVLLGEPDNG